MNQGALEALQNVNPLKYGPAAITVSPFKFCFLSSSTPLPRRPFGPRLLSN